MPWLKYLGSLVRWKGAKDISHACSKRVKKNLQEGIQVMVTTSCLLINCLNLIKSREGAACGGGMFCRPCRPGLVAIWRFPGFLWSKEMGEINTWKRKFPKLQAFISGMVFPLQKRECTTKPLFPTHHG